MGICRDEKCQKLVPIRAGAAKSKFTTERTWYPLPHNRPDGSLCDGDKKGI